MRMPDPSQVVEWGEDFCRTRLLKCLRWWAKRKKHRKKLG